MKNRIEEITVQIAENLGDYERAAEIMNKKKSRKTWNGLYSGEWNPCTLGQGLPGICLLYGKMMELYPEEEKWRLLAHDYLGRTVERVNRQGMKSLSMFSGLAGLGLCAISLSDGFRQYQRVIRTVNDGITGQFDAFLDHVVTPQGTHSLLYDVIEGTSGIVSYLSLLRQEDRCYEALKRGLKKLVSLTEDIQIEGYAVPGWYIPSKNQFSELEQKIYPQGNFNTSLSHGIAGPLIILSQMFREGIAVEGQRAAIEKIVDFYFRFRCSDEKREFWKGQLDFAEVAKGELTEKNIIRRDAWCYGSPGICYGLITAGTALDRPEWTEYGIQNLRRTMQDIHGIFSPTFCHGYAGLYQILNSAECILERNLFAEERGQLKEKILGFYDPSYVYGFYNMELDAADGQMCAYETVGLLDGAAGVCLALLEGEHRSKNVWKKAFLLDA